MPATLGDMKDRIARELGRTDLTTQIADEISSAIAHYERERFWFNEARETATMTAGQANFAVPTDMLEIDEMTVTYNGHPLPLEQRDWHWYRDIAGDDADAGQGTPENFVYYANQFWWYPIPDDAYPVTWSGVKQLAALSGDSDSNEWMVEGEELIRTRAREAVKINYLKEPASIAVMTQMAAVGQPFYSSAEKIAFMSLRRTSTLRRGVKRLRTDLPFDHSRVSLRGMF